MWITGKRVGMYLLLLVLYLGLVFWVGAHPEASATAKTLGMLFWIWLWYAWKLAGKATS